MTGPDTGVFIDAHHLLAVEARFRQPTALVNRVQTAASQLGLGTGISHRVVLADCSQKAPRQIAEALAHHQGFRIRHVPPLDSAPLDAVLASEAHDVAPAPGLKIVVFVASPNRLSPHIDTLHRNGKLVLVVSSDTAHPLVSDAFVELPLDPSTLGPIVEQGVAELSRAKGHTTDFELNQYLVTQIPRFRPGAYGYRSMRDVVAGMAALGFNIVATSRGEILYTGPTVRPSVGLTNTADAFEERSAGSNVNALSQLARHLCAPLASPRPTLQDQMQAMRDVVATLTADASFKEIAEGEGVPVTVLGTAFRAAVPGWEKRTHTITKIFQAAMADDDWLVVRNVANATIVHFVRGDHVPDGFEAVARSQPLAPDSPETGPAQ